MVIILLNGSPAGNCFYLTMYKKYLTTILWFNVNYRINIFKNEAITGLLVWFYNLVIVKKFK